MTDAVAVITHSQYPFEPRARRMAEALADHGYAVDVYCLRHAGEAAQETLAGVTICRLPVAHGQGRGRAAYFWEYLRFLLAAAWQVTRRRRQRRYRLVQVYNPPDILAFATLALRLLDGARVILDVRDMAPELFQSRFGLSADHALARLLRANERWACAYADAVTVCTTHQYRVMAARGIDPAKMTVVMNCPDETIFAKPVTSARDAGFTVLYHGGILHRYGLDVLLKAVPLLMAEIPHLRVEIYGTGDYLPAAQALAQRLGVTSVTRFHGYRPLEEMPAIIRAADVGVVPVRRDIFTDTILPTKLMEYAAMGTPAVVAYTSTISEYFAADMVAYFESGNPADLARQVLAVYRDPDAARQMAERAKRFFAEHNWQHEKAIYVALVDRLVGRTATAPSP